MAIPSSKDRISGELLFADNSESNISYAVPCLICKESIPVQKFDFGVKVCDNCRAAVVRLRQYIKEKEEF